PRHSRRLLEERAAARKLAANTSDVLKARIAEEEQALEFAWAYYLVGGSEAGYELARSSDPIQRAWGVRLVLDLIADGAKLPNAHGSKALSGTHPSERLALASGLTRIRPEDRLNLLLHLLQVSPSEDAKDPNLPLMTWYAMEPVIANDRG